MGKGELACGHAELAAWISHVANSSTRGGGEAERGKRRQTIWSKALGTIPSLRSPHLPNLNGAPPAGLTSAAAVAGLLSFAMYFFWHDHYTRACR